MFCRNSSSREEMKHPRHPRRFPLHRWFCFSCFFFVPAIVVVSFVVLVIWMIAVSLVVREEPIAVVVFVFLFEDSIEHHRPFVSSHRRPCRSSRRVVVLLLFFFFFSSTRIRSIIIVRNILVEVSSSSSSSRKNTKISKQTYRHRGLIWIRKRNYFFIILAIKSLEKEKKRLSVLPLPSFGLWSTEMLMLMMIHSVSPMTDAGLFSDSPVNFVYPIVVFSKLF